MSELLYGVERLILEEIDPLTQRVLATAPKIIVKTAKTIEMDPVISEGGEVIARNREKILAIARSEDITYGYAVKFVDNTFSPAVASLISGGTVKKDALGNVIGFDSALMSDGATMKPFRATMYIANYEGDSIKDYTKLVLNNCKGKSPKIAVGEEFYAPEFEIKAREATRANLPIFSMDSVDEIPAEVKPLITATTIGTLNADNRTITDIPAATTVENFLDAITIPTDCIAYVYDNTATSVTTGAILDDFTVRVYEKGDTFNKTLYILHVI